MTPKSPAGVPLVLALGALLVACSPKREFWRPERFGNQREAGSVHLAVLAVAPWGHYVETLEPDFQLDAEQALREVVRDTASSAEISNQALGIGLGVTQDPTELGLPTAPEPDTSSATFISLPGVGRPDAMLEYWSALALFQEVQLLNRAVRDAAIPSGYRPYLVRLSISLMPRRRNEPYDAYTTLSFFSPDVQAALNHEPPGTGLRGSPDGQEIPGRGPSVLPILVTDNLESGLSARSQTDQRNFALSMLGLPGNFGADLKAELFQEEIQAQVSARDLNSLLTVARVAENTLRVRLGALQQATAKYAMVPRNHYITLLLMVPEDAPPVIDLVARTVLVDTETGMELEGTSPARIRTLFQALQTRHGAALTPEALERLLACVQANDQQSYRTLLAESLGREPGAVLTHELWIDLVSLMVGSQYSSSRFELPGQGEWEILPSQFFDQTALLVDDGETATVTIHGATIAEHVEVAAAIELEFEGRAVTLPADEILRAERVLRLSFPSLGSLGLSQSLEAGFSLVLRWAGEEAVFEGLYVRRSTSTPP